MIEDESKSKRQEEGIQLWRKNKGTGILNYTMRFGKSKIAQMVVDRFLINNPTATVYVVTPNEITQKNIYTWLNKLTGKESVLTVYSCCNLIDASPEKCIECDLLIIDEIHKFLNPSGLKVLMYIKAHFKLGLTGTIMSDQDIKLLKNQGFPIIDTITEDEALKNHWISNFKEYNLAVELEEHDKEKYAGFSQPIHETLDLFKGMAKMINNREGMTLFKDDFNLIMSAFVGINYHNNKGIPTFLKPDLIRNIIAGNMGWNKDLDLTIPFNAERDRIWNPNNIYERVKQFKSYVAKRNLILIHNKVKLNAVLEILANNPVTTICFNESTEMVDDITDMLPGQAVAYHSNIETRHLIGENGDLIRDKTGNPKKFGKVSLKKLAIEGIKTGKFKYLITAKALDEGLDIAGIEQVITTAGSTSPTQYAQRNARGKTVDVYNPDKITTIINIYIDDFMLGGNILIKSRDKQKLIERQSKSENDIVWIDNISQIVKDK